MDPKSREIYEAPAAQVILKLHKDLEQYCRMKDTLMFKMYHGQACKPLRFH